MLIRSKISTIRSTIANAVFIYRSSFPVVFGSYETVDLIFAAASVITISGSYPCTRDLKSSRDRTDDFLSRRSVTRIVYNFVRFNVFVKLRRLFALSGNFLNYSASAEIVSYIILRKNGPITERHFYNVLKLPLRHLRIFDESRHKVKCT